MARINVLRPGLETVVQDPGRKGYEHLGIMVGGQLDDYAASWANRLLGNERDQAVLEVSFIGPELEALDAGWVSLAGADLGAAVNDVPWSPGTTRHLKAGDRIAFSGRKTGARAYLGFKGGLDIPLVFGSRATDLVARFGGFHGRALAAGDVLSYQGGTASRVKAPVATGLFSSIIRILPGVRIQRFPSEAFKRLVSEQYRLSHRSNRVGLRFEGRAVTDRAMPSDGISEGMAIGSIEIPPSGELLILMKSRGSIGGYPTLAHVITADLPVLAQLRPGDAVWFEEVSLEEARAALEQRHQDLLKEVVEDQEPLAASLEQPRSMAVVAPMMAMVYVSREPGGPPLAPRGHHVEKNQVLAILEVMKQFHEVRSPCSGTVVRRNFEDGQLVEEGFPLFEVTPDQY